MRRLLKRGCLVLLVIAAAALAVVVYQARRTPVGKPEYVALGSSFAAGAGLGKLQHSSPLLCARSINGYPQQLARLAKYPIVDMSCGGAVTRHLLDGGQFFQGPQIRVIDGDTRLVTITAGGNDVGYIGDLSMLAARHTGTLFGWLVRHLWSGPKALEQRNHPKLQGELVALLAAIHAKAPQAAIVVATYPTILPPSGTCPLLGLTPEEADAMRQASDQFAATTRAAAGQGGAILVDMHVLGAQHHACAKDPWTRGWTNGGVAPFHPTLLGAEQTAAAIASAVSRSPAAVTAVDQDDATGHQAGRVGRQE